MNRESNFGFGGRASGIRPPGAYHNSDQNRPKTNSTSSYSSIPSTASSRKGGVYNNNAFNFAGSGGSQASRVSRGGAGGSARQSMFGNFRANPFASARKSITAKIGPLFGLTPQHNRASYQPNSCSSAQSNRRSSIGGNRHVTDNRPLSEPSYQRLCVQKLLKFLTENPIQVYPHSISKTFSTRPTSKEIANIFEFLFMCFGVKGKVLPMDTEVPKLMASLEYPFPVKKSDLVSFTGGRALGSVLGMLEWLVDSLAYSLNMDPIRTFYPNFEGEIDIKSELISLCIRANDEGVDDQQIDSHLQELIVKSYGTEDDFEQMYDESEALEREIQRLDQEIHQIQELPQTIQTYESDIKSYDEYIQEMTVHHKQNEDILHSLEKDFTERLTSSKKLEEQRKALKLLVSEQEFGIEEAVLARERQQQLEDEIKDESNIVDDIKKGIRSTRLECSRYEDTLKKMHSDLDSFITAMTDLVESPVVCNYTTNMRQQIQSQEWIQILDSLKAMKGEETNATNVKELETLFSRKVRELKITIVQQLSALQGSVAVNEQQKLNEFNLLIDERDKQLKQNDKLVAQLKTQMETQRKDQVLELAAIQCECDRTRQLLSDLDGNTKRSHCEEKQLLLALRKQVEDKENEVKSDCIRLMDEFKKSIEDNKKGMIAFESNLDSIIAEEKTKAKQLRALLDKNVKDSSK